MSNRKKIFRNPILYIAFLLIITGSFAFIRSQCKVLHSDEVLYGYVLNTDTISGYWRENGVTERLTTFNQVVSSQINHYKYANGRTIVHTIEQVFTGIIGLDAFYFLNAFILILTIGLSLKLNAPRKALRNYLLWFIAIVMFMYLFPKPHRLWYSVNLSPNYLYPSLLMTLVFISFEKLSSKEIISNLGKALIIIVAFLFGWSHEGFSAPVGAAFFIYYLFHFADFKKNGWWFCLPLWIGTLIIILSPGALGRADSNISNWATHQLSDNIYIVFENLSRRLLLIILLGILFIGSLLKRISIYRFITDNAIYFTSITISFLVLQVLRPEDHAFTIIDIISAYLIIRIISRMSWAESNSKAQILLAIPLSCAFIIHQCSIIRDSKRVYFAEQKLINEYINTSDSIFLYDKPEIKWFNKPFVSTLLNKDGRIWEWVVRKSYGNWVKPIHVYNSTEYSFIKHGGFHNITTPRVRGNSCFIHTGDRYYWADADSVGEKLIELEYEPVDFSYDVDLLLKLKFALMWSSYPSKEIVAPSDTIITPNHTYYRIIPPGVRRISAIRLVDPGY